MGCHFSNFSHPQDNPCISFNPLKWRQFDLFLGSSYAFSFVIFSSTKIVRISMVKTNVESIPSFVSHDFLEQIINMYRISYEFLPLVGPLEFTVRDIRDRQVEFYVQFLLVGLRFLHPSFIGDVCRVYKIHVTQVSLKGFHKIIGFLILYKALDIAPDVDIFYYFYCTTSIRD